VVPSDDGDDLAAELLSLPQNVLGRIDLRRQRGDGHHVRREIRKSAGQVVLNPHVQNTKLMPGHRGGKHLQPQWFRHGRKSKTDHPRAILGLHQ